MLEQLIETFKTAKARLDEVLLRKNYGRRHDMDVAIAKEDFRAAERALAGFVIQHERDLISWEASTACSREEEFHDCL